MKHQADRLFWIVLLIPTVLLGVITLVFLHREASHIEEQQRLYRERLYQQQEERVGNVIVSILLSLREVEASLLAELNRLPLDGSLQQSLQELETHNQLVRKADLWQFRKGFLKGDSAVWNQVRLLPWLRSSHVASEGPLVPGSVTLIPSSPSQRSVHNRVKTHQQLMDLARTRSHNIPMGGSVDSSTSEGGRTSLPLRTGVFPDLSRQGNGWFWFPSERPVSLLGWQVKDRERVLVMEVQTGLLVESLRDFLPQSDMPTEFWDLSYRIRPEEYLEQIPDQYVGGYVSIGEALPDWHLFFYTALPVSPLSAATLRWMGSLLVIGITGSVAVGSLLLRRQLHAVHRDSRRKADFIANVSHELKTPLTAIQLYSEMLDSDLVSAEKKYQYLDTIRQETERLERLVENLLNQNRLERNAFRVQPTSLQVSDWLVGFAERVRPNLEKEGIRLTLSCPPGLYASADADAVQQILLNLVDNAVKYAGSGKEVAIEADSNVRGVILSVKDRGPGIRASFRKRLFSPFERGDNNLNSRKSGMGLGLSIARGQARAMGGDLIYAVRPGAGSVFSLILKHDPQHPLLP